MDTTEKNNKIIPLKNYAWSKDEISKIQEQVNEKIENEKAEYNISEIQRDQLTSTDILTALNNG